MISNSLSNITSWLWFQSLKIKSWPSYWDPRWGSWRVFTASPYPDSKLVNVISTWHLYWQPRPGFGRRLQCLHTMISCLAHTPLRDSSQLGHWRFLCVTEMYLLQQLTAQGLWQGKEAQKRGTRDKAGLRKQNEQEEAAPASVTKKLIYSFCPCCTDKGKGRTESRKPEPTPAGLRVIRKD